MKKSSLKKSIMITAMAGLGLTASDSIFNEAQATSGGNYKYVWCKKTTSYQDCGYGNGLACTTMSSDKCK